MTVLQTTKVYVSMEAPGCHLVVDGDLGLLRELTGSLSLAHPLRQPGENGKREGEQELGHVVSEGSAIQAA